MSEPILAPEDCRSIAEVRAGVDALDAALMELLARRFGYMRAAARLKPERDAVRDERRKAQVIANAKRFAQEHGVPPELVGQLWELLVEGSIAYELDCWDGVREES